MDGARTRLLAQELQLARSSAARPVYFHGTSMEPLLAEGDAVVVQPVAWAAIRPGDVVTYRFEDKFPTRRVIEKGADRLVLACDNWPGARFEAARADVLGRAVGRRRDGAWLWATDAEWQRARRAALSRSRPGRGRRALRALRRLVGRVRRRTPAAW